MYDVDEDKQSAYYRHLNKLAEDGKIAMIEYESDVITDGSQIASTMFEKMLGIKQPTYIDWGQYHENESDESLRIRLYCFAEKKEWWLQFFESYESSVQQGVSPKAR